MGSWGSTYQKYNCFGHRSKSIQLLHGFVWLCVCVCVKRLKDTANMMETGSLVYAWFMLCKSSVLGSSNWNCPSASSLLLRFLNPLLIERFIGLGAQSCSCSKGHGTKSKRPMSWSSGNGWSLTIWIWHSWQCVFWPRNCTLGLETPSLSKFMSV